jgi:hypothetical protein
MSACFGLGIASSIVELDTPRDAVLEVLRAIARFSGATVRDVLDDDEVVEVAPDGAVATLTGGDCTAMITAVHALSNSRAYEEFRYLDGFQIAIPGGQAEGEPSDLPDDYELQVAPLATLRAALDRLLARDDIAASYQQLHRDLRALCDHAERLRLPLAID